MTEDLPLIRTLVVDDEPLAREGVRMLLDADPEVEVVAECGSGKAAVKEIKRLAPDLVFLDVQMPEMNGLEVLAEIDRELRSKKGRIQLRSEEGRIQLRSEEGRIQVMPAVIFVTAYDKYALQAFEVHALDYLLKPFDDDRFRDALRRAKTHLRLSKVSALSARLISLLEGYGEKKPSEGAASAEAIPAPEREYLTRLAIKDVGRVVFLDVEEVDWIEAADYYVQLHTGTKTYLHRESMQSLEGKLDPRRFLRVHRSAIVNCSRVKELRSQGRRDLVVVLSGGAEIKVARSHRGKLEKLR